MTPTISHGRHPYYQTLTYSTGNTQVLTFPVWVNSTSQRACLAYFLGEWDSKYDSAHLSTSMCVCAREGACMCGQVCESSCATKTDLIEDWWRAPNVLSVCILTHSSGGWKRRLTADIHSHTHSHLRPRVMDMGEQCMCRSNYMLHPSRSPLIKQWRLIYGPEPCLQWCRDKGKLNNVHFSASPIAKVNFIQLTFMCMYACFHVTCTWMKPEQRILTTDVADSRSILTLNSRLSTGEERAPWLQLWILQKKKKSKTNCQLEKKKKLLLHRYEIYAHIHVHRPSLGS